MCNSQGVYSVVVAPHLKVLHKPQNHFSNILKLNILHVYFTRGFQRKPWYHWLNLLITKNALDKRCIIWNLNIVFSCENSLCNHSRDYNDTTLDKRILHTVLIRLCVLSLQNNHYHMYGRCSHINFTQIKLCDVKSSQRLGYMFSIEPTNCIVVIKLLDFRM